MSDGSVTANSYTLVMQADAAFYISDLSPLPIIQWPTADGIIEIGFHQHRQMLPTFKDASRAGLHVEVRGPASGMHIAVELWANLVRGLIGIFSTITNCYASDAHMDLCFEITDSKRVLEYARQSFPNNRPMPMLGRPLVAELAQLVIRQIIDHEDAEEQERYLTGCTQYHHALQDWEPGRETSAVNRMWIVVEAITPILRKRFMATEGLTEESLRDFLGLPRKVGDGPVNGELRRRLIFKGNSAIYTAARDTRNGTQHGFTYFDGLRVTAKQARDEMAGYVRTALLRTLQLPEPVVAAITEDSSVKPHGWHAMSSMSGYIIRDVGDHGPLDDIYPRVDWGLVPHQKSVDDQGDAVMGFSLSVRPMLRPGLSFRPTLWTVHTSAGEEVHQYRYVSRGRTARPTSPRRGQGRSLKPR